MTAVKVCCIQDPAEARMAAEAGATFVGLVGAMPSGPGPIADEAIAAVAAQAPEGVTPVLRRPTTSSWTRVAPPPPCPNWAAPAVSTTGR
jgi:phosphoribosylanthranilate isomerase